MDETPEELDWYRREAEKIDPQRYRKRTRALAAVAVGGLMAGVVTVGMKMVSAARNPCKRVQETLCAADPKSQACVAYTAITEESVSDPNPEVRSGIRGQCEQKLSRMEAR